MNYFLTFEEGNANKLNEAIAAHCKAHLCVEVSRSAPATNSNQIIVTSEFREMSYDEKEEAKREAYEEKMKNYTPVSEMNISDKTRLHLTIGNINYVEEIVELGAEGLLRIPGMGPKTIKKIVEEVNRLGFEMTAYPVIQH